jgi:hypothetical protein
MTRPRSLIAPPDTPGAFHCVQRCVRRAFLCGNDRYTGQCFEHRKAWIEARIQLVAECFAVAIDAYAVMSNHMHLVLRIDPHEATTWHDDEVAARWVRLFPPRKDSDHAIGRKCQRLLADPDRIHILRRRLGSLSWLMRCLVEPIARRANREDGCKGRFWEGRYKCQALCDDRAILAAMAYVDLNPIRAGMTDRLDTSAHTSVAKRIVEARSDPMVLTSRLRPAAGSLRPAVDLTTADYLQPSIGPAVSWPRESAGAFRCTHPRSWRRSITTRNAGPPASPHSAAAGIALPARHRISSHWPSGWGSDGSKEFGLP